MIEFRRLNADDAGEALTLQRAAFVSEAASHGTVNIPPLTETLDQLRHELASTITTGGFDGHRLVASARLTVAPPIGWISRVAVAPDRQGQGLGSRLLSEVEGSAPPSVARFQLAAAAQSHNNIRLYERLGFREYDRGPDAVGTPMVLMAKDRTGQAADAP